MKMTDIQRRLSRLEPSADNEYITVVELDSDPEKCRTYQRRATPEEKRLERKNAGVIVDLSGFKEDSD